MSKNISNPSMSVSDELSAAKKDIIGVMASRNNGKVSSYDLNISGILSYDAKVKRYCKEMGYEVVDRVTEKKKGFGEIDDAIDLYIKYKNVDAEAAQLTRNYVWALTKPAVIHGVNNAMGVFSTSKENSEEIHNLVGAFEREAFIMFYDLLAYHADNIQSGKSAKGKFISLFIKRLTREVLGNTVESELTEYACNTTYMEREINKKEAELMIQGDDISDEALAQQMGCSTGNVKKHRAEARSKKLLYFDEVREDEDGREGSLLDSCANPNKSENPETAYEQKEERENIKRILEDTLSDIQVKFVDLYFGFTTGEPLSESRVAELCGTNQRRVNRELTKAKEALKPVLGNLLACSVA